MTNYQIILSKGIKSNRQIERSKHSSRPKAKRTPLSQLGFNRDQRSRILEIIAEMAAR